MKKSSVFEDILSTLTRYFVVLVILVLLFIALSGVRFVKSGEAAVVLRFGKLVGDTYEEQVREPGLFFAFPYIIDEVITVPVGSVMEQTVTTHYTDGEMSSTPGENGYVITGDQNIAVITASVKYNITDAVKYALRVSDVDKMINAAVSNAMVESAAHRSVDGILTSEKEQYAAEVLTIAQETLDNIGTGVTLASLELTRVAMPEEVRPIYEQVNATTVQAETLQEEAAQYRATVLPYAEATASELRASAMSNGSSAIASANSSLAEFYGILGEVEANPTAMDAVRVRVANDKIMLMMSRMGRIMLVPDGDSKIVIN